MSSVLVRSGLRHLALHPLQTGISILGITLGVAVVVAVDLANRSADESYRLAMEQLTGKATHQIVSNAGGIAEDFYVRLRLEDRLRHSAPVVEQEVALKDESFTLLGIDPFAERGFRGFSGEISGPDLRRLLIEPGTVLMSSKSARRLGLAAGDRISVHIRGRAMSVVIAGLIEAEHDALLDNLLVADIATAQELVGRQGLLDRIDLVLDSADAAVLAADLPPDLRLVEPSGRTAATLAMSEAFHTNLAAMSLLALLVGSLLIYNTMAFSVLQRRRLLATLRALGVTRAEVFRLILVEALVLGLLGSLLGLLLGIALAQGLLQLVTRTINDLYYLLNVARLWVQPALVLKGLAMGLTATLVAAMGPALEAAGSQPQAAQLRSVIEHRTHRAAPWLASLGVGLALGGVLIAEIPSRSLVLGFVSLFLIIIGYTLVVPMLVLILSRLFLAPCRWLFGAIGGLATRGIAAGLSRTGLAAAALTVAVATTVGMGVMVASFRATVADWLGQTLRGDLYLSSPHMGSAGASTPLTPPLLERLGQIPGVAGVSSGRRVRVEAAAGPVELLAIRMTPASYRGFRIKGEPLPDLWPGFHAGELVLISEPYAYRHGLGIGDSLELYTAEGPKRFRVGAVFFDYGADSGLLVMDRSVYSRLWRDPGISAAGLYLQAGVSPERVRQDLHGVLGEIGADIRVRSNREIRQQSLEIFDRTFTITHVLRLLAVGVAFAGIFSALLAMLLERGAEHAVLRATGATRRQVLGLVSLQTGLMGLVSGLLALPLGLVMAKVLIEVINLRSFGWSLHTLIPSSVLLEALALSLAAALLAGIYPSWRIARIQPATALRAE